MSLAESPCSGLSWHTEEGVLAAVFESSAQVTVKGQMDSSPEDLSAQFSGDAVSSCVQAVSVFSSPGLEGSIQAGSPDPFSPESRLQEQVWGGEQPGANPALQMVTILPSPQAHEQKTGRTPDFILNPESYSHHPCHPALGRTMFPYMVKEKWGISAVHSHICAQLSLAVCPGECRGWDCQEQQSKIPPPCCEKGDEQTWVEMLQNGSG